MNHIVPAGINWDSCRLTCLNLIKNLLCFPFPQTACENISTHVQSSIWWSCPSGGFNHLTTYYKQCLDGYSSLCAIIWIKQQTEKFLKECFSFSNYRFLPVCHRHNEFQINFVNRNMAQTLNSIVWTYVRKLWDTFLKNKREASLTLKKSIEVSLLI